MLEQPAGRTRRRRPRTMSLDPTDTLAVVDGQRLRVWQGEMRDGEPVTVLVASIIGANDSGEWAVISDH
jgi:hypothetical protein